MPRLLRNLQIRLQHEGHRVVAICDSTEGIKRIEAQSFDLVITDLVLPGIDAFRVLEYLTIHRPEMVVVAVTGYIATESAAEAQRRGAYNCITKPFDYHFFKAALQRALEQARLHKR